MAAKAYIRLRQILTHAVDDDRIPKNPCRIAGGGTERHPEQRFATLQQLYDLAGAVPERHRALVLTAGLAGLRQGELFALRWGDVDLLHARITVWRKRLRLASGEVIEDAPKSDAGNRTVALPAPLVAELEVHLTAFGRAWRPLLRLHVLDGQPLERSNFRGRVWVPATRALGLGGSAVPRPEAHGRHPVGSDRGHDEGDHGETGARQRPRGDGLPARDRGPGPPDRRAPHRHDRSRPAWRP